MWLVIYRENAGWNPDTEEGRVYAIETVCPPKGAYLETRFEIKEWDGRVPQLANVVEGILADPDPTLGDPDYQNKMQQRRDFEGLEAQATAEIQWLDDTIPTIQDPVVKCLAQENRQIIKALRYMIRRLK